MEDLSFNFKFRKSKLEFGALAVVEKGELDLTIGRTYVWKNEKGAPSVEIKIHWNVLSGQIPIGRKKSTVAKG